MSLKDYMKTLENKEVLLPKLREFLLREHEAIEAKQLDSDVPVREDARLAAKCFQERFEEYNHGQDETNPFKGYFHPSAIGVCLRKLWFSSLKAPTDGSPTGLDLLRSHLIFETGTYVHVLFQNLCERAGVLHSRESLIVDHDDKIVGHADGVLLLDGEKFALEIKTINARGFAQLREPKPEHVRQANIYMHHLRKKPETNVKGTVFVYLEKDRHGCKEYVRLYNNDIWENDSLPRIEHLRDCIDKKEPPEREGRTPSAFPCAYCEYTKVCFDSKSLDNFITRCKQDEGKSEKKKRVVTRAKQATAPATRKVLRRKVK